MLVVRGWSQVVSGVVTLGCLSPRPRVHAPVLPVRLCACGCACGCACVHACACGCVRVCAGVCVPVGVPVGGVYAVWRCGVVWWVVAHTSFSLYLSAVGGWCGVVWCMPLFTHTFLSPYLSRWRWCGIPFPPLSLSL